MNHSIEPDRGDSTLPKRVFLARCLVVFCVGLLLYFSTQTSHAGIKGTSVDTWHLFPCIAIALVAAWLGKLTINSLAGVFLGGIGGAYGILDPRAAPYGGAVGLLVGLIAFLVPRCQHSKK